jgi:hypothetical protein
MSMTEEQEVTEQGHGDWSWTGSAVVAFVVGVAVRGLGHTDRFADGPLRHWYVHLAAIVAAVLIYRLGYRISRRVGLPDKLQPGRLRAGTAPRT